MAHNRRLVIGGVALTKAKIREKLAGPAMDRVRDELEQEIIQSGYLEDAPFKWLGLIIREGLVDETEPHYEKINHKDGDLPIAIEVDTHRLLDASEEEMAEVYREATLRALIHAADKYDLPAERLRLLLEPILEHQ